MGESARRRRVGALATAAAVAAALAFGSGCGGEDGGSASTAAGTVSRTTALTPEQRARAEVKARMMTIGRSVFQENCGGCHTLRDAGTTGTTSSYSRLDDIAPNRSSTKWFVVNGYRKMPSFRRVLSKEEIRAVSVYVGRITGGGMG